MSQKLFSFHIFVPTKRDTRLYQNFTCWSFLLQQWSEKRKKRIKESLFSAYLSLVFGCQALSMSQPSKHAESCIPASWKAAVAWCNWNILHSPSVGVSYQSLYFFLCVVGSSNLQKNFQNSHIFLSCQGLCEQECGNTSHTALNSTAVTLYVISNMWYQIQEASKTQICLSAHFPLKPLAMSMSAGWWALKSSVNF